MPPLKPVTSNFEFCSCVGYIQDLWIGLWGIAIQYHDDYSKFLWQPLVLLLTTILEWDECHTSVKTQLLFTSTWPTSVDRCPNRANTMCPTSTSDLRAAHVSLNIARGRGKLHKVKPAAVFIIFLHDLWPTGNGRTVAFENSRALICFDCYDSRKKRIFFIFWVFKKCLTHLYEKSNYNKTVRCVRILFEFLM